MLKRAGQSTDFISLQASQSRPHQDMFDIASQTGFANVRFMFSSVRGSLCVNHHASSVQQYRCVNSFTDFRKNLRRCCYQMEYVGFDRCGRFRGLPRIGSFLPWVWVANR
jgi:hypothetical protein